MGERATTTSEMRWPMSSALPSQASSRLVHIGHGRSRCGPEHVAVDDQGLSCRRTDRRGRWRRRPRPGSDSRHPPRRRAAGRGAGRPPARYGGAVRSPRPAARCGRRGIRRSRCGCAPGFPRASSSAGIRVSVLASIGRSSALLGTRVGAGRGSWQAERRAAGQGANFRSSSSTASAGGASRLPKVKRSMKVQSAAISRAALTS